MNYKVQGIPKEATKDWILNKHYAHRLPPMIYAFGLFNENQELEGVCTFGMPCMQMNDGNCIFRTHRVRTLELNRLVVNENLGKNVLSFFVSKCIKQLPKPLCLVSFADPFSGHNGYIYQATNWLYTGMSEKGGKMRNYILNGHAYHGSSITEIGVKELFGKYNPLKTLTENWIENGGEIEDFGQKHRYIMFLGKKKDILEMKNDTVYSFLPYPKGENKRYDSSFQVKAQKALL